MLITKLTQVSGYSKVTNLSHHIHLLTRKQLAPCSSPRRSLHTSTCTHQSTVILVHTRTYINQVPKQAGRIQSQPCRQHHPSAMCTCAICPHPSLGRAEPPLPHLQGGRTSLE